MADGDAGNDETVINGAPTAGDQFTIKPQGNWVRFDRVNLGLFFVDLTSERLTVNGLGGNDTMTADLGLAPRSPPSRSAATRAPTRSRAATAPTASSAATTSTHSSAVPVGRARRSRRRHGERRHRR